MKSERTSYFTWRTLVFSVIAFACSFQFASLRAWSFGADWSGLLLGSLVFFILFAFPVVIVILWGSSFRKALIGAGILTLITVIPGEVFASAQERMVIREFGKRPNRDVSIPRWPPFGGFGIWYSSTEGWFVMD
jgi:hypothetical protein